MHIQLQYLENDVHQGGLYLNVHDISSVRNDHGKCIILMSCGTEYEVVQPLGEVLEMIGNAKRLIRDGQMI